MDIFDLLISDILLNKVVPIPVNNRGHLGLTKVDLKKVKTLMVVHYSNFFYSFHLFLLAKARGRGECSFCQSFKIVPPPTSTTFLGGKILEGIRYAFKIILFN